MLTLYAPEGSALKRDWLRWGFLVIGAAAFADAYEQWWAARTDPDRIPFGMNEGAGLSDPSVLSDRYGWNAVSPRARTEPCNKLVQWAHFLLDRSNRKVRPVIESSREVIWS